MLKAYYEFCADNPISNGLNIDYIPTKAVPIAMTKWVGSGVGWNDSTVFKYVTHLITIRNEFQKSVRSKPSSITHAIYKSLAIWKVVRRIYYRIWEQSNNEKLLLQNFTKTVLMCLMVGNVFTRASNLLILPWSTGLKLDWNANTHFMISVSISCVVANHLWQL